MRGTCLKIFYFFKEIDPRKKILAKRSIKFKEVGSRFPIRYFDSASSGMIFGYGAYIVLRPRMFYHF